jgi:hypothetical protein
VSLARSWFIYSFTCIPRQNPAELDEGDTKKKGDDEEEEEEKELPDNYDPCYFPPGASCVR